MLTDLKNRITEFLKKCQADNEKPLLVILGPTASGKTNLSLRIAQNFDGEIISGDSRQIYRHMDIGTDKIPLEKRKNIPHHLIDIVNPDERFTVADFKKIAEEKIEEILARKKTPMIVGGTGLYIQSITKNYALPPENPRIRAKLYNDLNERGIDYLYSKLQKCDPENAKKIHKNNIPYVIRALEIIMTTGTPKTGKCNPLAFRTLEIGLAWPHSDKTTALPPELVKRIEKRVDEQIERGLVEETKELLKMGYAKDLPAMTSLGYQEIIQYLEGKISLKEATDLIKLHTRNFAKRQITWFKRDKEILWYAAADL